jgi:hypothetical protein
MFLEKAMEKGGAGLCRSSSGSLGATTSGSSRPHSLIPDPASMSRRQQSLLQLATKTVCSAGLDRLEAVEEKLASRVQRAMLVALVWYGDTKDTNLHACDLHRWHLRRALPGTAEKSGSPVDPEEVEIAEQYLTRILQDYGDLPPSSAPPLHPNAPPSDPNAPPSDPIAAPSAQPSPETSRIFTELERCQLCYDVGEHLFSAGDFARAGGLLQRALDLAFTSGNNPGNISGNSGNNLGYNSGNNAGNNVGNKAGNNAGNNVGNNAGNIAGNNSVNSGNNTGNVGVPLPRLRGFLMACNAMTGNSQEAEVI